MRSIFGKILLWFSGMLVLAAVSFVAVSVLIAPQRTHDRFAGTLALQLDGARTAWDHGGPAGLASYLERVRRWFPGEIYLTDATGRDLLTSADRSGLIEEASADRAGRGRGARLVISRASDDGKFRLVVVPQPPPDLLTPLPYYAWIPLALGILTYLLALHLAKPARDLRGIVERFGRGDLAVRSHSTRRDEFGDLARAFDRMAGRIERLIADQRRLLQDVSHELRSPLTRLGYAIELARVSDNREEALARIRKDVDRLTALVSGLLEAARGDVDRPSQVDDVSLGAVVAEVVDDCRMEIDARPCRVAITDDGAGLVRGAPELIRRAVENVVRNAIRHAPADSTVDVTLRHTADVSTIIVRDHGPGVPEDQLDDIFRPFFRVEGDRNRETGGVGLGLAITRQAVAAHDGRVVARNAHPGLEIQIDLPSGVNKP